MGPSVDKAFLSLGTKPVLAYSLLAFERCSQINMVVVVARRDRVAAVRAMAHMFGCAKVKHVVAGGTLRQDSVVNGLNLLEPDVKIVAVHDGARPCVTPELIAATIESAIRHGSGVAATKIVDTVKQVDRGLVVAKTVDRSKLWAVQTPQTFRFDLLLKAYAAVAKGKLVVTDEASAVELLPAEVHLVPGAMSNLKITTTEDLPVAAALLKVG